MSKVDIDLARKLREKGKTYREIGTIFGVTYVYISLLLNPKRLAKQRLLTMAYHRSEKGRAARNEWYKRTGYMRYKDYRREYWQRPDVKQLNRDRMRHFWHMKKDTRYPDCLRCNYE